MPLKIDFHVHSIYSRDSVIQPKDIVFYAKKRGLDGVAVTDHNRIDSALKIAKENDFLIIPGTEVSSVGGHIVGLNVNKVIPKGLSVNETVDRIHDAGGIAIACHPFSIWKNSLGGAVSAKFDAVEVVNARSFPFKRNIKKAKMLAKSFGLACVGGTDAHYGPQIGFAYALVDAKPTVSDVIQAILERRCEAFGMKVPFILNFNLKILRLNCQWHKFRSKASK